MDDWFRISLIVAAIVAGIALLFAAVRDIWFSRPRIGDAMTQSEVLESWKRLHAIGEQLKKLKG